MHQKIFSFPSNLLKITDIILGEGSNEKGVDEKGKDTTPLISLK